MDYASRQDYIRPTDTPKVPGTTGYVTRRTGRGNRCWIAVDTVDRNRRAYLASPLQKSTRQNNLEDYSRRSERPASYEEYSPTTRRRVELEQQQRRDDGAGFLSRDDDDEESSDNYDFDLASLNVPETVRRSSAPAVSLSPALQGTDLPNADFGSGNLRPPRQRSHAPHSEWDILRSRWVGNVFERGDLTADITLAGPSVNQVEKRTPSLIKWYHMQLEMMDFEEFMAAAAAVVSQSPAVNRDVVRLLRDVQKKHEQQRQYGRDMNPNYTCDAFYLDSSRPSTQSASVSFLAFPYHTLAKYDTAQMEALPPWSPLHPLRPMLQAQVNSTTQKRELSQAVTMLPGTEAGECIHISQIWCLIVNSDTILTSSRLSANELCGNIGRHQAPQADDNNERELIVNAGSGRSWAIPVSHSTTWPTFLSIFDDFLSNGPDEIPQMARFETRRGVINGADWPSVRDAAGQTVLDLRETPVAPAMKYPYIWTERPPKLPLSDGRAAEDDTRNFIRRAVTSTLGRRNRNVNNDSGLEIFALDGDEMMTARADGFDEILLSNDRIFERTAFEECPVSSLDEIEKWFSNSVVKTGTDRSDYDNRVIQYKRKFTLGTRFLFATFWPANYRHRMTDKYWGAVNQILNRWGEVFGGGRNNTTEDLEATKYIYRVLHEDISPAAMLLKQTFFASKSDLSPQPEAFSKAWLHLIISLVLVSETPLRPNVATSESAIGKHLEAAAEELKKGRLEILARLRPAILDDLEICRPTSLIALCISFVSRDIMHGRPDVESTYVTVCQTLEAQLIDNPLLRSHKEKLRFLAQEIQTVLTTLQKQASVIDTLVECIVQQSINEGTTWLDNLGPSRQSVVLDQCAAAIAEKIDTFTGLLSRVQDLTEWQTAEKEANKDRQESAILVFTIVTIIFLPLSFVASVFGMNTKDIRDTNIHQWAYWVTALPITFFVVSGSLWWAGFFEDFGPWLPDVLARPSRRSNRSRQPDVAQRAQVVAQEDSSSANDKERVTLSNRVDSSRSRKRLSPNDGSESV